MTENHGIQRLRNRFSILILVMGVILQITGTYFSQNLVLRITHQVSGQEFLTARLKPEDQIRFGWEHSFEHVTWNEYYTVLADGTLKLDSIAVGGFGAGIPAEMDCTYRYEDGLVYMENLENSIFRDLRWIHSQTQVKFIELNGEVLVTGPDLPQRQKIMLRVSRRLAE